jgi:magnesium transporter
MARLLRNRSNAVGLAPGAVVFSGQVKAESIRMRVIDFDLENLEESQIYDIEDAFRLRDSKSLSWLNIDGLHDVDLINRLGMHFNIHPLVLEDIVHPGQRPKLEDHGDYLYIVVRMLYYDEVAHRLLSEQLSLIVGPTYVLSFQERHGDVFDPVRERIRSGGGRIRKKGSDYLAYALLDILIDRYFIILEAMNIHTEELESSLLESTGSNIMTDIGDLRRELILLRKAVWPARDLLGHLQQSESKLIRKETKLFLRDAYDHTIQVIDIADSLRDMIGVLRDSYQSVLGNRMNEVMKVLTIIATIFIPLTFLAGIYGMNFERMPELSWPYAYPTLLGVMLVVGAGMVWFFRKKDWL